MAEGKYYWLKLKRDFFKRHDIRIIEKMPNGKDYVLFYLKLLLESIDHEGSLRFNDVIPYNDDMLSAVTDTNIDIVRSAMKLFIGFNMIEVLPDDTIYMREVERMIGSETKAAERKRKSREKQLLLEAECDNVTAECDNVQKCHTEKEKEFREESLENRKRISFNQSLDFVDEKNDDYEASESAKREYMGGELGKGVVMLSEDENEDLLDKLSFDEYHKYIKIVAEKELKGHHYKKKTHYQAILDMAMADRKKARR